MSRTTATNGKKVGLVGLGTVGLGWAAVYLANGVDVAATDPSHDAEKTAVEFLSSAIPLVESTARPGHAQSRGAFTFSTSRKEIVADADIVHENIHEDIEAKRGLLRSLEQETRDNTIIASSSGGIPPSLLQDGMLHPERFLVAHPFNPPHLIPLVEIIGGPRTARATVDSVVQIMRAVGKHPITLQREMTAYLTNRLQFALLREAIFCLSEGVATPQAIEDAVKYGLAPRWLALGPLSTFFLAGGAAGIDGVLSKFGPAIQSWWDDLGTPTLSPEIRSKLVDAQRDLLQKQDIAGLQADRDLALTQILALLSSIDSQRQETSS